MWPEYTINLRIAGEGDVTVEKRTKAFFSFASGPGFEHDASRMACIGKYFVNHGSVAVTGSVIETKFAALRTGPRMNASASLDLYARLLIP